MWCRLLRLYRRSVLAETKKERSFAECEYRSSEWGSNAVSQQSSFFSHLHILLWCIFIVSDSVCGLTVNNIWYYLLTYLLTPWCRVLLEKLTGLQLVKKFPVFHGTRRFITALTSLRHPSLSWASPIQSIYPHSISWRSTLILSTHLRPGLPSGLFPSSFPTKTLYTPFSSPIRATCPAHLILLDFVTRTILGEVYKSFSSSLCNLLHSPGTSSLLYLALNPWNRRSLFFSCTRKECIEA